MRDCLAYVRTYRTDKKMAGGFQNVVSVSVRSTNSVLTVPVLSVRRTESHLVLLVPVFSVRSPYFRTYGTEYIHTAVP